MLDHHPRMLLHSKVPDELPVINVGPYESSIKLNRTKVNRDVQKGRLV